MWIYYLAHPSGTDLRVVLDHEMPDEVREYYESQGYDVDSSRL